MRVINKGENLLIRRNLQRADGSVLLLAEITSLSVSVIQDGSVIEAFTYPSTYLRQGDTTSQLELEISTTNSNKLKKGDVTIKYTIVFSNAEFEGEGLQTDIIEEKAIRVV